MSLPAQSRQVLHLFIRGDHPDDGDQELTHIELPPEHDRAALTASLALTLPALLSGVVTPWGEHAVQFEPTGEFRWTVSAAFKDWRVTGHVTTPLPASVLLSGAHVPWTRQEVIARPDLVGGEDDLRYLEITALGEQICRHCGSVVEWPRRAADPLPPPCVVR